MRTYKGINLHVYRDRPGELRNATEIHNTLQDITRAIRTSEPADPLVPGGAADNLTYVVISNTTQLSAERSLSVATPITLSDAGADSTVTLGMDVTSSVFNRFLRSDVSDNYTAGTLALDAGTILDINGTIQLPTTGITGAGTGSGLDADLLDGREATGFLWSDNTGTTSGLSYTLTSNTPIIFSGSAPVIVGTNIITISSSAKSVVLSGKAAAATLTIGSGGSFNGISATAVDIAVVATGNVTVSGSTIGLSAASGNDITLTAIDGGRVRATNTIFTDGAFTLGDGTGVSVTQTFDVTGTDATLTYDGTDFDFGSNLTFGTGSGTQTFTFNGSPDGAITWDGTTFDCNQNWRFDGSIGIGVDAPTTSRFRVDRTYSGAPPGTEITAQLDFTATGTTESASSRVARGVQCVSKTNSSGTNTGINFRTFEGGNFTALFNNSAAMTWTTALQFFGGKFQAAYSKAGIPTASDIKFVGGQLTGQVTVNPGSALTINELWGAECRSEALSAFSNATITNAVGIRVGNDVSGAGAATRNYGILIDQLSGGTTKWAINASVGDIQVATGNAMRFTGSNTVQGNVKILAGSGTPESVVTAAVGSIFLRTDGAGSTSIYVKEVGTGSTGWVGK